MQITGMCFFTLALFNESVVFLSSRMLSAIEVQKPPRRYASAGLITPLSMQESSTSAPNNHFANNNRVTEPSLYFWLISQLTYWLLYNKQAEASVMDQYVRAILNPFYFDLLEE